MHNLVLIFIFVCVGYIIKTKGLNCERTQHLLSFIIINLCLPATALLYLQHINFTKELAYAAFTPWFNFLLSSCTFILLGKLLKWNKQTIGAFILLTGIGNTSFVGLPMTEALVGKSQLPTAVVIDQLGTFLILSTLGLFVAILCSPESEDSFSITQVAKKILKYPPFLAIIASIFWSKLPAFPGEDMVLERISSMLAPLALISIGMRLSLTDISSNYGKIALATVFKLVIYPIVVGLFFGCILKSNQTPVVFIEACMGPSIAAGIIATQHKLEPRLTTLFLSFGILLSLFTTPILFLLLKF